MTLILYCFSICCILASSFFFTTYRADLLVFPSASGYVTLDVSFIMESISWIRSTAKEFHSVRRNSKVLGLDHSLSCTPSARSPICQPSILLTDH